MSQPNVVPRVNSMVQSMDRPYIDLTGSHQIPGAGKHFVVHFCKIIELLCIEINLAFSCCN